VYNSRKASCSFYIFYTLYVRVTRYVFYSHTQCRSLQCNVVKKNQLIIVPICSAREQLQKIFREHKYNWNIKREAFEEVEWWLQILILSTYSQQRSKLLLGFTEHLNALNMRTKMTYPDRKGFGPTCLAAMLDCKCL
jgi:hypothetical protein